MRETPSDDLRPQLIDVRTADRLDVLGPTIQFLTSPDASDETPCVMRGVIKPGIVVPLHSHDEPETFHVVSGEIEALVETSGPTWLRLYSDDVFDIPAGARHAFRNTGHEPAVMLVITSPRLGRFFRDIGAPVEQASAPPSPQRIERFHETAARYGYWNGTAEQNTAVGITLPGTT